MLISLLRWINIVRYVKYIRIPKGYLSNTKILLSRHVISADQENKNHYITESFACFNFNFFSKIKSVYEHTFFA